LNCGPLLWSAWQVLVLVLVQAGAAWQVLVLVLVLVQAGAAWQVLMLVLEPSSAVETDVHLLLAVHGVGEGVACAEDILDGVGG